MKNVLITAIALVIIVVLLTAVAVYGQREMGELRVRANELAIKVASLEALETVHAELRTAQEKLAQENQTKMEAFNNEITTQQEKIAKLESGATGLESVKTKLDEEIADLKEDLKVQKREIDRLKEQLASKPQTATPIPSRLDLRDAPPEVAEWIREEMKRRAQGQPPRQYPEEVRKWMEEQMKKQGQPQPPEKQGPVLGVTLSPEESDEGIIVKAVALGSGADKAGIKESDIITEIDGKKISTFKDLQEVLSVRKVGDTVKVKILREDKEQILDVTLGER